MGTEHRTFADGRYELFEPIGSGGMATVYRAHDHRLGVARAIKVLLPSYASKDRIRARFEAEARMMAVLDHPNIVRVYDVGANDETAWIVMELVEGGSLVDKIGDFGIEEGDCLTVTAQVLEALAVAHAHGVVHRDIKPHNVLLSKTGLVRITDFGIARCAGLTEDSFTKTGTVMGTWAFMAPEQRVNAKGVDHTADLYGTGATLFTMCTGQTPMDLFAADLAPDMLKRVPESLVAIIRRATRYNREERYPNASSMLEAVQSALDGLTLQTDTVPTATPTVPSPATTTPNSRPEPYVAGANEAGSTTKPSEPTNVTYLGIDLASPPPVLETPTLAPSPETLAPSSNLTPLPFRPSTPGVPAAEAEGITGPSGFTAALELLPTRRTMFAIAIILVFLIGGGVKRLLKSDLSAQTNQPTEATIQTDPNKSDPAGKQETSKDLHPREEPASIKKPTAKPVETSKSKQTKSPSPETKPDPVAVETTTDTLPTQAIQKEHTGPPSMLHGPSGVARMGGSYPVSAQISNLHPLELQAYKVTAYYRAQGSAAYKRVSLQLRDATWQGSIPIDATMESGLEYFVKAKASSGSDPRLTSLQSGSNSRPHRVRTSSP